MTITKPNREIRSLSPRSVDARYFHFYDHAKNSRLPSILRRKNQMRFTNPYHSRHKASTRYSFDDESRTESESSLIASSCFSPSEKILKIIMTNDLDCHSTVPSSFSPPSNKLLMKKSNNEYREVSCNNNNIRSRNSVRFHSKVLVMRIPSRNQYPESIKRNLWSSLSEIAKSAQRNTIEFSSEGWNWRSAIEEDSMYVHPRTRQRIHPVHLQRAISTASTKPDKDKQHVPTVVKSESECIDDQNIKTNLAPAKPAKPAQE